MELVESNDIKPITNDLGVCLKMGPPSGCFKGENDDKPSEKPDCTNLYGYESVYPDTT